MSKESKKQGQAYRREARRVFAGYQDELIAKLEVFNQALKIRPKYFPRKLWNWLCGFFIDMEKMQNIINPKKE
jgi:hypothetical protein